MRVEFETKAGAISKGTLASIPLVGDCVEIIVEDVVMELEVISRKLRMYAPCSAGLFDADPTWIFFLRLIKRTPPKMVTKMSEFKKGTRKR